jgi:hypothetical protein
MSTFALNCLLLNDDAEQVFTAKIHKSENVSVLKDLIKEKKSPHLDHLAASDLILWKVRSLPICLNLESDPIFVAGGTNSFVPSYRSRDQRRH